jgi:hypothetical protein
MSPSRRTAVTVGVLFLITHVTSVPAVLLYDSVLGDRTDVLAGGGTGRLLLGGLLDVVLALAVVGTAVAVHPVVKRWGSGLALGYVGLRTLEAAVIVAGVAALLGVVTLRRHGLGAGAEPVAEALVAVRDWTFILGPGLVCGTNTVLLATLMHRSRLVPRYIALLGLVGGPLVFGYNVLELFGVEHVVAPIAVVFVLPVFAWEVCLAVTLVVRGFAGTPQPGARPLVTAASTAG